jgi:hypothetical protein
MIAWIAFGIALVALLALAAGTQSVGASEYRRRLAQQLNLWPIDQQVTFTGTVAETADITSPSSIAGLSPGMSLSGLGIPAETTILSVTGGESPEVVMSQDGTADHSATAIVAQWLTSSAEVYLMSAPYTGGPDPIPSSFTEVSTETSPCYAAQDV